MITPPHFSESRPEHLPTRTVDEFNDPCAGTDMDQRLRIGMTPIDVLGKADISYSTRAGVRGAMDGNLHPRFPGGCACPSDRRQNLRGADRSRTHGVRFWCSPRSRKISQRRLPSWITFSPVIPPQQNRQPGIAQGLRPSFDTFARASFHPDLIGIYVSLCSCPTTCLSIWLQPLLCDYT
jgi:hypothetical protein